MYSLYELYMSCKVVRSEGMGLKRD